MAPDLIAPSVVFGWLVCFTQAVLTQAVGERLAAELVGEADLGQFGNNPFQEIGLELAVRWLATGPPAWVGAIRPLLQPALAEALAILRAVYGSDPTGWRWGRLHRVELHHPLAQLPLLGRLWRPLDLPIGGDGHSVNQAESAPAFPPDPVRIIASCRMIVDVGAWDNSLSVLPGGQSGHPASPHYQDQVDDWHRGRYHPMLFNRKKIEAAAVGHLHLQPLR